MGTSGVTMQIVFIELHLHLQVKYSLFLGQMDAEKLPCCG